VNSRFLSTHDGKAITVTPGGSYTEVTYMYGLDGAPQMPTESTGRPRQFQPTVAEVVVQDGETAEIVLAGPRVTTSGKRSGTTLQRAMTYYKRYQVPWDSLPEWAEPLITLHDSYLNPPPGTIAAESDRRALLGGDDPS